MAFSVVRSMVLEVNVSGWLKTDSLLLKPLLYLKQEITVTTSKTQAAQFLFFFVFFTTKGQKHRN